MKYYWIKYLLLFLSICITVNCFAEGYTLGNWSYTSSLNVARFYNVAVLSRSTIIYTFGGYAYTNTPYPVERATIQPNGSLSSWSIESTQMNQAHAQGLGFATDSYVYAIGGGDASSVSTTVDRAPINSDGTLGVWTTIGACPVSFANSALVQYNQYIYVVSGYQGGLNVYPYIYRTMLNSNGSLGTWTQLSSQLLVGRQALSSIIVNTTLYVVGGVNSAGFDIFSVEKATIFPDGQLSTFTIANSTIQPHDAQGFFYDGTYLNTLDGNTSERAKVNSDGSLSNWVLTSGLLTGSAGYGYVQTTTTAYMVGGYNEGDSILVEYAPILNTTEVKKSQWETFE